MIVIAITFIIIILWLFFRALQLKYESPTLFFKHYLNSTNDTKLKSPCSSLTQQGQSTNTGCDTSTVFIAGNHARKTGTSWSKTELPSGLQGMVKGNTWGKAYSSMTCF